jgi:hypothetical protein
MPKESLSTEAVDGIGDLIHDLRNSLYVFQIGLEVLPAVHGNSEKFQELVSQLKSEERRATLRLEKFTHDFRNQHG